MPVGVPHDERTPLMSSVPPPPRDLEAAEASSVVSEDDPPQAGDKKWCYRGVLEPVGESLACIVWGGAVAIIIVNATGISASAVTWIGLTAFFAGVLEHFQVRRLGVTKSLANSAALFKKQNRVLEKLNRSLTGEIRNLVSENQRFAELNGLLGENVRDIEQTKEGLFSALSKYEEANKVYKRNNLIHTWNMLDADNSNALDTGELRRLKLVMQNVYGTNVDTEKLDTSNDGKVSFDEFIKQIDNI